MNEEEQLSGEESLRLINRMIYEARGYFYENGLGSIIYGFTTLVCCALTYMRDTGLIQFPFHPFYLMVPVFFVQAWIRVQQEKKKMAKTFTDEAIDIVWNGFAFAVLAALCAAFAGIQYIQISMIIILSGMAANITGMLTKWRYLIVCSFICMLAGIASFFVLRPEIYFLLAGDAVLICIVPGFMMNAYFKKQQHGK
jgi:hypothetical protein